MAKATKTTKTAEESAMAKNEKHNDGTMSGLKKTVIGTISTLVVGGGTFLMSYLQKPKESDNKNQPAININIPQQQQTAGGTKTVIVKEKSNEAKQADKPQPKPKKKEGDEFKEEAPKW